MIISSISQSDSSGKSFYSAQNDQKPVNCSKKDLGHWGQERLEIIMMIFTKFSPNLARLLCMHELVVSIRIGWKW